MDFIMNLVHISMTEINSTQIFFGIGSRFYNTTDDVKLTLTSTADF